MLNGDILKELRTVSWVTRKTLWWESKPTNEHLAGYLLINIAVPFWPCLTYRLSKTNINIVTLHLDTLMIAERWPFMTFNGVTYAKIETITTANKSKANTQRFNYSQCAYFVYDHFDTPSIVSVKRCNWSVLLNETTSLDRTALDCHLLNLTTLTVGSHLLDNYTKHFSNGKFIVPWIHLLITVRWNGSIPFECRYIIDSIIQ